MAFFKFPWAGGKARDDKKPRATRQARVAPADSIDVLRRRARHRLIGATVLVLCGVLGFPLLFDTQPRPVAVDIPIEIPNRNKVAPLAAAGGTSAAEEKTVATLPTDSATAPSSSGAPASDPRPASENPTARDTAPQGLDDNEEIVTAHAPASAVARAATAKPAPAPRSERKTDPVAEPRADETARARALLEDKPADAAAAGRFVVQIGAFGDAGKAREVRMKAERSGLKTYTQSVETKEGPRIRVRVGPFASKADAEKAAGRIKGLDLPATLLTL